jgi:hypothetical protein
MRRHPTKETPKAGVSFLDPNFKPVENATVFFKRLLGGELRTIMEVRVRVRVRVKVRVR